MVCWCVFILLVSSVWSNGNLFSLSADGGEDAIRTKDLPQPDRSVGTCWSEPGSNVWLNPEIQQVALTSCVLQVFSGAPPRKSCWLNPCRSTIKTSAASRKWWVWVSVRFWSNMNQSKCVCRNVWFTTYVTRFVCFRFGPNPCQSVWSIITSGRRSWVWEWRPRMGWPSVCLKEM